MSQGARALAWLVTLATLLVALVFGAFLAWLLSDALPPGTAVVVDGHRHLVHDVLPANAWQWALAVIVVLLAALIVVLVVPVVAVLAMAVPLLLGGLGISVALLTLALLASPLILLGWWLWHRPRRNATTIAS